MEDKVFEFIVEMRKYGKDFTEICHLISEQFESVLAEEQSCARVQINKYNKTK